MPEPRPPSVPDALSPADSSSLSDDREWRDQEISGDFSGQSASGLEIDRCRISSAVLVGAEIEELHVTDTVIEDTDLSGALLAGASFRRVELTGCRLSGIDLGGARFEDVRFSRCRLDGANLRMMKAARFWVEGCDLFDADLYEARLPEATLFDCDLTRSRMDRADLTSARLHGSRLEDVTGNAHLTGAVIDTMQLVPLGQWLVLTAGIVVDDERARPAQ